MHRGPTSDSLRQIVDQIKEELKDWDKLAENHHAAWNVLAQVSGMSVTTLYKLRDMDYAEGPRFSTIAKVANVFGLKVTLDKKEAKKGKSKPKLKIRRRAA